MSKKQKIDFNKIKIEVFYSSSKENSQARKEEIIKVCSRIWENYLLRRK